MGSSAKLLEAYLNEGVWNTFGLRKLWVIDFDDTLVKTSAVTHVKTQDGKTFDLTPAEFAVHDKQPGETFDFTDFTKLINPRAIKWTNHILRRIYDRHGPGVVVILSARSIASPIEQFLHDRGLSGIEVVALNNPDPLIKSAWIDARIRRDKLDVVEFLDDSPKNVAAVNGLRLVHPDVKITARRIVASRISSLHA